LINAELNASGNGNNDKEYKDKGSNNTQCYEGLKREQQISLNSTTKYFSLQLTISMNPITLTCSPNLSDPIAIRLRFLFQKYKSWKSGEVPKPDVPNFMKSATKSKFTYVRQKRHED